MDVWTDYWNMYNEIFTLGRYPDPWKQAIVVPILKKINQQKIQLHIQTHITITRSRENLRFTSTQQTWNILGNRGLISVIQTGFRKVLSKRNHISKECTPTHAHNSLDLHILNKQSWFYLKGKWWWLMAACLPLLPRQTPTVWLIIILWFIWLSFSTLKLLPFRCT